LASPGGGPREDLLTAMLDEAMADVPRTEGGTWQTRLTSLVEAAIRAMARHQGLAIVSLGHMPNGANALLVVDAMIALLKEAGLDDPTISWAVDLLYLFITACAAEQSVYVDKESEGQTEAGVVKALEDYYATVSAEPYPMVFALRRQLMVGTGDERGSWALKVLINGILGTPAEIV
jgi:hypothetical protein